MRRLSSVVAVGIALTVVSVGRLDDVVPSRPVPDVPEGCVEHPQPIPLLQVVTDLDSRNRLREQERLQRELARQQEEACAALEDRP